MNSLIQKLRWESPFATLNKMKNLVLVSGPPSVGKSQLAKTAREKGIFSVILEEQNPKDPFSLDKNGLRESWEEFWTGRDVTSFKKVLKSRPENLILLEWGFRPDLLHIVERMRGIGIVPWWLEGDPAAAERSHATCSHKSMSDFHRQMTAINASRTTLAAFYGANRIVRLDADGKFLPDEEVLKTIFGQSIL
jgi:hypothetical protein